MSEPHPAGAPTHAAPFTPDSVRAILDAILRKEYRDAEWNFSMLAVGLNMLSGWYRAGNYRQLNEDTTKALETLCAFFKERQREAREPGNLPGTAEAERQLYDAFQRFMDAMDGHTFNLRMDIARLMAPTGETWHPLAQPIGRLLAEALVSSPKPLTFGRSNNGPVPRLAAAVIPLITGDTPSVGAVAQHLKSLGQGIQRRHRTQKTRGTISKKVSLQGQNK